MSVHRTDIPVRLKYSRQIFSDFFPTNDSYYWQATLRKRAAFFKCHDNPCCEKCIEKRIASLLHGGGSKTGSYHNQWILMICNDHRAKQSEEKQSWNMSTHVLEECKATPHRPACLGLNHWLASIVSRLTLPKLQFSHITSSILCLKPSHECYSCCLRVLVAWS